MAVEAAQIGAVARGGTRAEAWWTFPAVPLLAAAIAFTWTLRGELQRIYGMTGSAWDLAYDQQVIWNISQGQGFYTSFARANFLGIHLELIFTVPSAATASRCGCSAFSRSRVRKTRSIRSAWSRS